MMRAFLRWVVRGRVSAIGVAALGLLVPPFSFVSAGITGLVTLRFGAAEGGIAMAASVIAAGLVSWPMLHTVDPMLIYLAFTGVPVWGLCAVLRATASQGVTLVAAGSVGALAVVAIHLFTGDPVAWWREVLEQFVVGRLHVGSGDLGASAEVQRMLDVAAPLMRSLPAGVVAAAMMMVLLSRWWHSLLDRPGGFAAEFRALRTDRRMAVAAVAVMAAGLLAREQAGGLWPALLEMLLVLYAFQGLAVVHAVAAVRELSVAWLVGMYVVLFTMPPTATTLLAATGLADAWFDFRRRLDSAA